MQAYLQSACSVLNFDIGEIWVCRDVANSGTYVRVWCGLWCMKS